MDRLSPTPPCRPMLGDAVAILGLGTVVLIAAVVAEVVAFRAAAAEIGPELIVRACSADRPGVCETRTYPTCDRDMVADLLAAEGLVVRMAVCRAPLVEV